VYGQVTGYGPDTEARDTAAYDIGAFWAQAGVAMALTAPGGAIPQQRGGMGDHMTGQMCVGAICAALYNREKTGEGQRVAVSWCAWRLHDRLGCDARCGWASPPSRRPAPRDQPDHRLLPRQRWQVVLVLLLRRTATGPTSARSVADLRGRAVQNIDAGGLTPAMERAGRCIRDKTREEWGELFRATTSGSRREPDPRDDHRPVVRGAGAFVKVPGRTVIDGRVPADFSATQWARSLPPELGQHTEEVLLELGRLGADHPAQGGRHP
jgi:crotonobetainyl-CoA:carnitine CoA-transferase CaiB-like acyl-CoA transferase